MEGAGRLPQFHDLAFDSDSAFHQALHPILLPQSTGQSGC
jgi:hypothetical protein